MTTFSPEFQTFLSLVVQAAIPILGTFLLGIAGYASTYAVTWLKTHVTQAQLAQVKSVVDLLVASAEQSGLTGSLSSQGSAKKQWVLDEATKQLTKFGLSKFAEDVPAIEQLIEASVYELTKIKTPPIFDAAVLSTEPPVITVG